MKHTPLKSTVFKGTVATIAAAAMLMTGTFSAQAAGSYPSDSNQPDLVSLLSGYNEFWQPDSAYDSKKPETFGHGTVKNKSVMDYNDSSTVAINNAAAEADGEGDGVTTPTAQQKRALIDSDYSAAETFAGEYGALGSTLDGFLEQGLSDGSLPKTSELLTNSGKSLVADYLSTGTAKTTFNHPRPYLSNRTDYGYSTNLDIKKVPTWTDENGKTHDASYDGMVTSGSFPSGHTTYAYSAGILLATLLPQLGPEILARASEAGNNRIVLGVHYSLDIMGGRIDGEAANTARWSDQKFREEKLMPAYNELQNYMADQCVANNIVKDYGDDNETVRKCADALNANSNSSKEPNGGYQNSFTDAVSTKPVTDRKSAIDAYTARMTYGFQQTGTAGQAAVVPDGAEHLLDTAFPTLTDNERKQVLAASEIDSGYPLDDSSQGYQRINLAKAFSAEVTLDSSDPASRKITSITFGHHKTSVEIDSSSSTTVPTQPNADKLSTLLSDYNNYWDFYNKNGVVDGDKSGVLKHDDELTEEINNKAAGEKGTATDRDGNDQQARAYSDSLMDSTTTLYDSLGPVLGKYYQEGMKDGKLSKTSQFLEDMDGSVSTSTAKKYFEHPRPYVDRKNFQGKTLDLGDLKQTLNIQKVDAYENDGQYDGLASSGSFPSGHTTFAFTQGTGLSVLLPELGPEIMARVSEAGNNRIVLGVHYPLDILGGHIAGQYGVATALNDADTQQEAADARTELVDYLTAQCKANNQGDTLQECINNTGANDKNGYTNSFTDDVTGDETVTDRKSAIDVYTKRMTYGFSQTGQAGQAAVVPDEAVNLLDNVEAFKDLTVDQKKAVLAATEGDSGYPLDASSDGWARINLAAALSSKVTLSADGKTVVKVEPGQTAASVVREDTPSTPSEPSKSDDQNSAAQKPSASGKGESESLSDTGASVSAVAFAAAMLVLAGGTAITVLRKRNA